jgi:hypothetical protein
MDCHKTHEQVILSQANKCKLLVLHTLATIKIKRQLLFLLMANKIRSAIIITDRDLVQGLLHLRWIGTTGELKDMMSVKGVIILVTIETRVIVNTTIVGISAEVQNQVVNQAKIRITDSNLHQEVIMIDVNPTMDVTEAHVVVATTKVTEMIIDKTKSLESDVASLIPLNQHLNYLCGN